MRALQGKKQGRREPPPSDPEPQSTPEVLVEDPAISNKKSQIIALLERSSILVLKLTNSSARTWQLPEVLFEEYGKEKGFSMMVTTRSKEEATAAARTLSMRLKSQLGQLVGYDVDQERKLSHDTPILFMTSQGFVDNFARTIDPHMPWKFILMDTFNQRSLEDEIAVKLIQKRQGTKLILMLSEANVNVFSVFLKKVDEEAERIEGWAEQPRIAMQQSSKPPEPEITSSNQIYDVKVYYLNQLYEELQEFKVEFQATTKEIFKGNGDDTLTTVSESMLQLAAKIVTKQFVEATWADTSSSVLVFLPNVDSCKILRKMIEDSPDVDKKSFSSLILQTTIPDRKQNDQLRDSNRIVIFTTSIIENTIKIPSLRVIIDFGLTLERSQDDAQKVEEELIRWASKSLIRQRSSRVERYQDGIIFRLMPEGFFQYQLYDFSKPEIHRFPLDKLMLKLRQTGVGDVTSLFENKDFQPLELKEIEKAEDHLSSQGALSNSKEVTWIGQVYLRMPCNLRLTRMCLFGAVFGCLHEAVTIAAILAQNKSLFRSFKYEPFMDAQKELFVQQAKMRWDSDSDMIGALRLFETWLIQHGQKPQQFLASSVGNSMSRPGPTNEETKWCQDHFTDPETMRDIIVARNDMMEALEHLGVNPRYLSSTIDILHESTSIWPLQLCIAGALTGNYLVSDYLVKEEEGRERIRQKIGKDTRSTLLIEQVSDAVSSADLEALFRRCWPNIRIRAHISTSNAIVQFPGASEKAIRMALWLSTCSMRHKKGLFVIMKDRVRKKTDESLIYETMEVPKERWADILRNFPTGQSRAGVRHQIRPEVLEHTVQSTEVFFIPRPLYAHQLLFDDMETRHHVSVSEDSVAYKVIEIDESLKNSHLGVFFQYEYGRIGRMPIAKYVTLVPVKPLMPHLMVLLFSSDVELFTEGHKYAGLQFKHSAERLFFDFDFSAQDLSDINEFRERISACFSEDRMKHGERDYTLVDEIWQLACKRRLQKIYEMKQWERLLGEDRPSGVRVTEGVSLQQEFRLLPAIPKLDVRDVEESKEDVAAGVRKKKQGVLDGIMMRVKMCEVTQTELVCAVCKSCITLADTLEVCEETADNVATFILHNTFGTIEQVQDPGDAATNNKWLAAFIAQHPKDRVSWITCLSGHIFGYHFFGVDYFQSISPVLLRFPTLKEMKWKPELWKNDLFELKKLSKKYQLEQREKKVDLTCELCDMDLESQKAFCVHVRTSKEHKQYAKKFMEDVVS